MFGIKDQIKVVDRIDHFTKSPAQEAIAALYDGEQAQLMFESVDIADIEQAYFADFEPMTEMMLEAIKAKASRLKGRMAAVSRAFNQNLKAIGLEAGETEISKPRKSGAVAIQTAKIAISDGQSVSLVFHAPDNDPLKINSDDTLIAFRFLLNSRDVTHIVAPAGGRDISLKQTTLALSNLVEKNAPKFAQNKAKIAEQQEQLDSANAEIERLEAETEALSDEVTTLDAEAEKADKRITTLESQIANQNEIQEELRKQIADKQAEAEAQRQKEADPVDKVQELFSSPALKAAISTVRKDGNSGVFSSLATIADIDLNGSGGYDRSLFVSSMINKVKRMAKNGEQDKVDNILTMFNEYNKVAHKPAVTLRNSVWKLGEPKKVEVTEEPPAQEEQPASNDASLKRVGDRVALGSGEYVIKDIFAERALIEDVSTGETTLMSKQEFTNQNVFLAGMHTEQEALGDKYSLADELKPALKGLSVDGWFETNGQMNFKGFDAIYDALVAAGYTGDQPRLLAQQVRNEHNMGDVNFQSVYLGKPSDFGVPVPEEVLPVDIEAIRDDIKNNIVPALQAAVADGNDKQERAGVPASVKADLKKHERALSQDDAYKDDENVWGLQYAYMSQFADTALTELANTGWTDAVKKESDEDFYWYGLQARPYGMGTTPNDAEVAKYLNADEAQAKFPEFGAEIRHGAVAYAQPLTDKQIYDFELKDLAIKPTDGSKDIAENIVREFLYDWTNEKGVQKIAEADLSSIKQAVHLNKNGLKGAFSKLVRQQEEFQDRKSKPKQYQKWNNSLALVTPEMIQDIAEEGFLEVEAPDANAPVTGAVKSLETAISELNAGNIGLKEAKGYVNRNGDIPAQFKGMVSDIDKTRRKNKFIEEATSLITALKDYDINAPVVTSDGQTFDFNQTSYDGIMPNMFGRSWSGIAKEKPQELIHFIENDHRYSDTQKAELVEVINEHYLKKAEPVVEESGNIDLNELDEEARKEVDQLLEYTDFKLMAGQQTITFPEGETTDIEMSNADDLFWKLEGLMAKLGRGLHKKADKALSALSGESMDYYTPEGKGVTIYAHKPDTSYSNPEGAYGDMYASAGIHGGERFNYSLYPVSRDGQYTIAVISRNDANKGDEIGTVNDFAEFESLMVQTHNLSTENPVQPEPESTPEMEHTDKLKEIRDYSGEATLSVVKDQLATIEAAYAYFEEQGTLDQHEPLLEDAFKTQVRLQGELK